jgi:hypothetical protein
MPVYRSSHNTSCVHLNFSKQLFKSNLIFALFMFLLSRLPSGAFTIDSSTPPLRRNLNEDAILVRHKISNYMLFQLFFKRLNKLNVKTYLWRWISS